MATASAPNKADKRSDRFNIRTTPDEKDLVAQAARISKVSMTQFIRQAAMRSAEEVLADQTRFTLPPDKWEAFVEALDRPAREIPALKQAASKSSPFRER
ncbi:MAG: DUF1778 domain-containing protein [Actinobacteria bacterium HGW-Actinobacteria-10]|jgi:uncharacterized protein (DUF1778 family)|nr:MAG: DUF1778 domain-containing protein [Actinobacteria bacterium HGW-Actinobacteria-10]